MIPHPTTVLAVQDSQRTELLRVVARERCVDTAMSGQTRAFPDPGQRLARVRLRLTGGIAALVRAFQPVPVPRASTHVSAARLGPR